MRTSSASAASNELLEGERHRVGVTEAHAPGEAFLPGVLRGLFDLPLAHRDPGDVDIEVPGQPEGRPADAATDIEKTLPGAEAEFTAEQVGKPVLRRGERRSVRVVVPISHVGVVTAQGLEELPPCHRNFPLRRRREPTAQTYRTLP